MTYRPDVLRVASDDATVSVHVRAVSVPSKIEAIMSLPEPDRLAWKARNESLFRQIEARRADETAPAPTSPVRPLCSRRRSPDLCHACCGCPLAFRCVSWTFGGGPRQRQRRAMARGGTLTSWSSARRALRHGFATSR